MWRTHCGTVWGVEWWINQLYWRHAGLDASGWCAAVVMRDVIRVAGSGAPPPDTTGLVRWQGVSETMDTIAGSVTTRTDVPQPSLQERIETLTDVHQRLQSLRRVPTLLLRPPSGARLGDFPPSFDPTMDREFGVTFNSTPGPDFGALKVFVEVLCSDKVQEALHAARASEEGDTSEVGVCIRGQGRKRKYVCLSGVT